MSVAFYAFAAIAAATYTAAAAAAQSPVRWSEKFREPTAESVATHIDETDANTMSSWTATAEFASRPQLAFEFGHRIGGFTVMHAIAYTDKFVDGPWRGLQTVSDAAGIELALRPNPDRERGFDRERLTRALDSLLRPGADSPIVAFARRHGSASLPWIELGIKLHVLECYYYPHNEPDRRTVVDTLNRIRKTLELPDHVLASLIQAVSEGAMRAEVVKKLASCREATRLHAKTASNQEAKTWADGPIDPARYMRVASWRFGTDIALLAFAEAKGTSNAATKRRVSQLCRTLSGIELPSLHDSKGAPLADEDEIVASARALNYLLDVAPKKLAGPLELRYGDSGIAAFETGMKTVIAIFMYAGKDNNFAATIERAGNQSELPEAIWQPISSILRDDRASQKRFMSTFARVRSEVAGYLERDPSNSRHR